MSPRPPASTIALPFLVIECFPLRRLNPYPVPRWKSTILTFLFPRHDIFSFLGRTLLGMSRALSLKKFHPVFFQTKILFVAISSSFFFFYRRVQCFFMGDVSRFIRPFMLFSSFLPPGTWGSYLRQSPLSSHCTPYPCLFSFAAFISERAPGILRLSFRAPCCSISTELAAGGGSDLLPLICFSHSQS